MSESLWHATLPAEERVPRASLPGDLAVDVAIVGAGYTGLWTAYALKRADPALRVVVCEGEVAGFGASGRNGGWCSTFFAGPTDRAMQLAMFDTLDEIERVVRAEEIDCDWARGGVIDVATNAAQVARMHEQVARSRRLGFGDDDYCVLAPDDARKIIGSEPNLGALYSPRCAAIHPAKLARGLARAVERLGVPIYEHTPVRAIEPGRVETAHGQVRADVVVRATEAFSPDLPGLRRSVAPVYSLMIATEPLPSSFWANAGLHDRPTFADLRHMVIYGQRTADDRFAFGGRGTPYHFGSRVRAAFERDGRVFRALQETLRTMFPGLGDAAITHAWGGAVAVPRDWHPYVTFCRATGMAAAGGYVGDGVSTTNLAGRTLADLILGRDTDITHLKWVGHKTRPWEPEPLRWLGVNLGRVLANGVDRAEAAGKPARLRTRILNSLI